MSIFHCVGCDNLRDADDGCDEAAPGSFDLICVDCMEAREAEDDASPPSEELGAAGTDRTRDDPLLNRELEPHTVSEVDEKR